MRRSTSAVLLMMALCGSAVAQTATMPPHGTIFTGNTRGYYFTSPAAIRITGIQVLQQPGGTNAFQNWAVVRFHNNTPPPLFSATTNAFDQLAFGLNDPANTYIPVNIAVQPGDVIGIYGNTAAASGTTSGVNSYTGTASPPTTDILGNIVTLFRSGMQFHLGSATSPQGMHDIWAENSNAISRVEFTYAPLDPNAVGACCFSNGTCEFITLAACDAGGGSFRGENVTCAAANCPQPGACCMSDGSCDFIQQTACTVAGGTWSGAGVTCAAANCPQPAACCFFDGSCAMLVPVVCTAQGGTPGAAGSACATTNCPGYEFVTNLPGVFTDIAQTGAFITSGDDSSVAFVSSVVNEVIPSPNLFASTNGVISSNVFTAFGNTALPAAAAGRALFPFWDDLFVDLAQGGSLVHQGVNEGGINVHIVQWTNVRTFAGGAGSATGTFQVKIFESGPILAQFIYENVDYVGTASSNGASATIGFQADAAAGNNLMFSFNTPSVSSGTIVSLVTVGGAQLCYANCDGSTIEPVLNVDDFTCFINEYAAAQGLPPSQQLTHYANCDGSSVNPVLNVDDFTCFINEYAQGCR